MDGAIRFPGWGTKTDQLLWNMLNLEHSKKCGAPAKAVGAAMRLGALLHVSAQFVGAASIGAARAHLTHHL
jgi:hypothetical protein